jgi:hypothetical protein
MITMSNHLLIFAALMAVAGSGCKNQSPVERFKDQDAKEISTLFARMAEVGSVEKTGRQRSINFHVSKAIKQFNEKQRQASGIQEVVESIRGGIEGDASSLGECADVDSFNLNRQVILFLRLAAFASKTDADKVAAVNTLLIVARNLVTVSRRNAHALRAAETSAPSSLSFYPPALRPQHSPHPVNDSHRYARAALDEAVQAIWKSLPYPPGSITEANGLDWLVSNGISREYCEHTLQNIGK